MKIFSSKPKNKFGWKLSNPKELRHHSQQKYISPPPEEKKPTTKETLSNYEVLSSLTYLARFHPITKLIPEIQKNKRQLNGINLLNIDFSYILF